ncbi:MAG: sce7726 family protein [Gammaproteobacteria bacterium]|nr:sce7726 family protein [Gammaproteobacteria bacterium]
MKLFEPDIKAIVLNHFLERGVIGSESLVMDEFTIDNKSRRVDLALYYQGKFIGIEIKSEADSLYRLEGQLDSYTQYFDKTIVVSATKHLEDIRTLNNSNIGLWEISPNGIKVVQRGKTSLIKDKSKLTKLMLKNELNFPVSKTSIKDLRNKVEQSLRSRFTDSSEHFVQSIKHNQITADDIHLLSRFKSERQRFNSHVTESLNFWENWSKTTVSQDLRRLGIKSRDRLSFGEVPADIKELIEA